MKEGSGPSATMIEKHPNNSQKKLKKPSPFFGLLEIVTLKILFVDLLVSIGDVGSDFGFSYDLYLKSADDDDKMLEKYAAIVFSINWFPGRNCPIEPLATKICPSLAQGPMG